VLVENNSDELWMGVKGQSNSVIARSLRNSFRASLVWSPTVVELWMDSGPFQVTKSNQTPNAVVRSTGVRQWGISFIVERERTQTAR
jgi:hypothetical protein